eukprot:COSAG01_NODE_3216_length_6403_cov_5.741751_3_plen_195_part_00
MESSCWLLAQLLDAVVPRCSGVTIFYYWKPTTFVSLSTAAGGAPFAHVSVPGTDAHVQEDMSKFISPVLARSHPAAFTLLSQLSLRDEDIDQMLTDLPSMMAAGGLSAALEASACKWINEHNTTWEAWVQAAVPSIASTQTTGTDSEASVWVAAAIGIAAVFTVVLAGVAVRMVRQHFLQCHSVHRAQLALSRS